MREKFRWLKDPVAPSVVLFVGMSVSGFVALAIGWKVAARTLVVAFQIPAVVSGGLAGLALVCIGAGLTTIQVGRRLAAEERVHTDLVLEEAGRILKDLRRVDPS